MSLSRTYGGDEPVRLNKFMGQSGVCSRREADALIADGLVSVDGEVVTDNNRVGEGVTPADEVSLPPIGRLDEDSRGLLLLSSDGVVAKAVIGPESDLDKEYLVRVTGDITEKKLKILRHGLMLDGRQLRPAYVSRMESHRLKFILREGRNRQIRRMCEMVDLEVTDLIRVRIGPLKLDNLPEGRWRLLTADERAALVSPGSAG